VDSGLQGTAFAQKGGRPKKGKEKKGSDKPKAEKKDFDKEYFKDLPCFKCRNKGYPQSHCPTKTNDDNNLSIFSRSSWSSKSGRKPKIKDFENQFKNLKKSSAQLKLAQEAIPTATPVRKCRIFSMVSGSMGEGASQKR
jgi:hypothetical protein